MTMFRPIFWPDQLTNTGSFLPADIPGRLFLIFMNIHKCLIKSGVMDNIAGPAVAIVL